MSEPPTGIVTFLFTDIEGSTGLLQSLGDGFRALQEIHDAIIQAAIDAQGGHVVRTEGDAFFVTFHNPSQAVRAVVAAQRDLVGFDWPSAHPLQVRMGLHTGHGVLGGGDYIGIDVHRAARIAAAASGRQILISDATRAMVQHDLPDGVALRDLGQHRLKDIAYPEHLFDLVLDGLPGSFPAIRSLDVQPNNLPLQLTSFVGRADEIAQTVELLGSHRLVTLTGPGGSGKTRLALQVAAELLARFEDGVFFVDLVPVADHTQVPSVLAQVLGMREQPRRGLIETLVDGLAAKEVLLLLDNFEHVLPAAWVAERLLGAAPRLRILVTSRAPLRIYGEQEQQVLPLALPDPDSNALEVLSRCEAIALFSERARAAQARFALTEENARVVADVCARLDGLPLAIELAASRIKVLTPQAIRSRLAAGLDVIAATARNLPPRQRTLRATISWSCGQLTEPEQRLFARLSVFRGGAGLEAVHAVGNPGGDLGVDTLEVLTSLIDNSLVRQTELPDGEPRFGMLETIREYAAELLAAQQDSAPTERRHAEHFLALAHEGEPHLTAVDQVAGSTASSMSTTTSRQPSDGRSRPVNRSAGCRQPPPCGGSGSSGATSPSDGVGWSGCCRPASTRRQSLRRRTWLRAASPIGNGTYEAADQHYQEALAISRALDDRHGIAEATYNLAFVFAEDWRQESRTGRRGRIRSGCCETPWPNSRSWTIALESQRQRGTLRCSWPGWATSTRPCRCSRRPSPAIGSSATCFIWPTHWSGMDRGSRCWDNSQRRERRFSRASAYWTRPTT